MKHLPEVFLMFFFLSGIAGVIQYKELQRENRVLGEEINICVNNYLSNIPHYVRPLWSNEDDKQQFLVWLREDAERIAK
jgi:hypothetical protein